MALRLTQQQQDFLLSRLPSNRVSSRTVQGRALSYLEASDVKRFLIRTFGFGGFDFEVLSMDLAFEQEKERSDKKGMVWNVGYRALVRLRVYGFGDTAATYTEAAVGFASLGDRGEAHDMACKTAESDALKRCAIYLGTQFGLSLYFGTHEDVVGGVLSASVTAPPAPEVQPVPETPADQSPQGDSVADGLAAQVAEDVANGEIGAHEALEALGDPVARALGTLADGGVNPQPPAERTDDVYRSWMQAMRDAAVMTDNAGRVQRVQQLQEGAASQFGAGFLDEIVTIAGQVMTYRTLCANTAAGAFVPKEGQ